MKLDMFNIISPVAICIAHKIKYQLSCREKLLKMSVSLVVLENHRSEIAIVSVFHKNS
jgi:hypothetical protein